jgi:hypothetical protein
MNIHKMSEPSKSSGIRLETASPRACVAFSVLEVVHGLRSILSRLRSTLGRKMRRSECGDLQQNKFSVPNQAASGIRVTSKSATGLGISSGS